MRLRIWTAIAVVLALAVPALAHASGAAVIKACTDGTLSAKHFSQQDYAQALANLPADVDEYTDCRAQIQRGQLSGGGGGDGKGGSGSGLGGFGGGTGGGGAGGDTGTATAPTLDPLQNYTPAERATYQKAVATGDAPVNLDGRPISAGRLGGSTVNSLGDLPAPLLAILALLAAGGLAAAALGTRRLVHGRRPA